MIEHDSSTMTKGIVPNSIRILWILRFQVEREFSSLVLLNKKKKNKFLVESKFLFFARQMRLFIRSRSRLRWNFVEREGKRKHGEFPFMSRARNRKNRCHNRWWMSRWFIHHRRVEASLVRFFLFFSTVQQVTRFDYASDTKVGL